MLANYIRSLLQALSHCHAHGVVHGDIKPENIMIDQNNQIQLIDFNVFSKATFSDKKSTSEATETVTSTMSLANKDRLPYYLAPEVILNDGRTSSKSDIWSVGVLLYTLVCGYQPFQGNSVDEITEKIRRADYHFRHAEFGSVSPKCKDLIRKLLVTNPQHRLSCNEALSHPWFVGRRRESRVFSEIDVD